MLRIFLFLSVNLMFILSAQAQKIFYKGLNSLELQTERIIKIYVPASYEKDKARLYPLTILLDGDYLFDVYVGNAKLFAERDKAPEQIIVGIMQNQDNERYTDCSYDKVSGLPTEDSDKFYRFIHMELLDYLSTNYRLSPFRTLVGNTLTANFINYFLVENNVAFDAFININPYYNPDMPVFLQNKLSTIDKQKVYYYLNSGSYNPKKRHDLIKKVAFMIESLKKPNILLRYDNFEKSTKTASIGQAIPLALSFIFDIYSAISKKEFDLNVANLSPADAIAYLENKYVEIEYLFGTNMKIRERDIYAIESIVIDQEDGEYLVPFGEMIQKLYPESPLSDYYIGMYYEKNERYKQALKQYKNGYAKIDKDSDDAEAYYQNIQRVLDIQKKIKQEEDLEKERRKAQKKLDKLNRAIEKEERARQKELEKEERAKQKELEKEARKKELEMSRKQREEAEKLKKEAWEKRKEEERKMREKYRKK